MTIILTTVGINTSAVQINDKNC